MKPKKKKDLIEETCKAFPDKSPELIYDIINFYWKEGVHKSIENLVHYSIFMPKLGSFNFVRKKIPLLIQSLSKKDDDKSVEKLEKIKRLEEILKKDYEILNEKRKIKEEYYKNLEKQMENT